MKAFSLDQAVATRDDIEPLVLRAVELDGELTIVPVPEDRDLDRDELEELARWHAEESTARPGSERGAPSRGGPERERAAPRPEGGEREAGRGGQRCGCGAGRYRTLHYASAMQREPTDGEEKACTPETGGEKNSQNGNANRWVDGLRRRFRKTGSESGKTGEKLEKLDRSRDNETDTSNHRGPPRCLCHRGGRSLVEFEGSE